MSWLSVLHSTFNIVSFRAEWLVSVIMSSDDSPRWRPIHILPFYWWPIAMVLNIVDTLYLHISGNYHKDWWNGRALLLAILLLKSLINKQVHSKCTFHTSVTLCSPSIDTSCCTPQLDLEHPVIETGTSQLANASTKSCWLVLNQFFPWLNLI